MAPILLDTTILIDLLRGRPGATQRLGALRLARDVPHACAVNVEEIVRGVRPGPESESAERLLEGLEIAPLGRNEGRQAGRWRRSYAVQGLTLSQAGCLIAAAALGVGGRLATGNPKDFPMPELAVEHWPVGV
jgi:predicted nucleic acid-binding protein